MGRGFREDEGAHALRVDRAAWCASVPGVATVVRHGGRLVPIKDAEIENISRVAAGLAPKGVRPEPEPFQTSDPVRVVDGPFRGVMGVAIERRGRRRVLVSLDAVGLGISIDVDRATVEALQVRRPLTQGPCAPPGQSTRHEAPSP